MNMRVYIMLYYHCGFFTDHNGLFLQENNGFFTKIILVKFYTLVFIIVLVQWFLSPAKFCRDFYKEVNCKYR